MDPSASGSSGSNRKGKDGAALVIVSSPERDVTSKKRKRASSPTQQAVQAQGEQRTRAFDYEKHGVWTPYDDVTQGVLVIAYEDGAWCKFDPNTWDSTIAITINQIAYAVDFARFVQINLRSGHERRIRLIVS
jgi:hypothetical protein